MMNSIRKTAVIVAFIIVQYLYYIHFCNYTIVSDSFAKGPKTSEQ